jgi:hypothetical protein
MPSTETFGNTWHWSNKEGKMVSWTLDGVPLRSGISIPMPYYGIVKIDQLLEVELIGQCIVLKAKSALAPEEDITLFNYASSRAAVALPDLTEVLTWLSLSQAPWRQ